MSSKTWGSVVVALATVMAMPVAAAHADGCSTSAGTTTCIYTGADTTGSLTIPDGVSSVTVSATGASGRPGTAGVSDQCTLASGSEGGAGGQAARVTGTLAVSPADVLSIVVGSATHAMHGGDGGPGGSAGACNGLGGAGGAGGGASYISRSSVLLLVAAGGGGGGGGGDNAENCSPGANGGDRDQNGGDRKAGACTLIPTTEGGGGAADSTGDGNGGAGGGTTFADLGRGGGGGGGVNGGDGGAAGIFDGGAGGGGGGSKVPPSGSISTVSGSPTPQVTISYVSDTTPPTTTVALSPASPNGAGWYTSAVGVSISAIDGGSGVAQTRCVLDPASAPASFSDLPATPCPYLGAGAAVSTDGAHTVYAASIDNAGNPESVTRATFKIDTTAPTITAAATTAPNANGWYRGDVTVHFTCADAGSGIAPGACPPDQTLSGEGATVSSTSQTVSDAAANVSAASNTVTVKIDRTAPADVPAVAAGTVGQNGWYVSDVSVDWHWSDGLSGVDPSNCRQTSTSSGEGSAVSVSSACADLAGNGASDARTFKIDKTPPTLTCGSPPTFVLGSIGNQVHATASDAGSGAIAATVTASASATAVGSHSVALTGSDTAGNTTTVSCTYIVAYGVGRFELGPRIVGAGDPVVLEFTLVGANGHPISDADARSLVGPVCKIAVHVSVGGPISGCPRYGDRDREFHFAFRTNIGMAGPNGASFTVTIGSTIVATSPVRHFLVVVPYRHGRRLTDARRHTRR